MIEPDRLVASVVKAIARSMRLIEMIILSAYTVVAAGFWQKKESSRTLQTTPF